MPARPALAAMNEREAKFCSEYLVDLNATQAAIRAGYSKKTAYSQGPRLLKRVEVAAEVARLKAKRLEMAEMSAAEVLAELAKIARSNVGNYASIGEDGRLQVDFSRMTKDDMAAISSVEFDTAPAPAKTRAKPEKGGSGRTQDATQAAARALVSKIKLWDKPAALALLARHHDLLKADPTPPPPPNNERRMTVVKVLVQQLEARAAGVHVHVQDGPVLGQAPGRAMSEAMAGRKALPSTPSTKR